MPRKINMWLESPAESHRRLFKMRSRQARLNANPSYVKHCDDTAHLCAILTQILFVETKEFQVFSNSHHNKPGTGSLVHVINKRAETSKLPLPYDSDGYETAAYQDFHREQRLFFQILKSYARDFRQSEWNFGKCDRSQAVSKLGRRSFEILRKGLMRASGSYDVGSSLYIYQQMFDRNLSRSPSLSKAAWLVKNAPLRFSPSSKHIPRGKWKLIQEHWKHNKRDAHIWAAIVVATKSPFQHSVDLLLEFICDVDVDTLKQLARTFQLFRTRVCEPKGSNGRSTYLKYEASTPVVELDAIDPIPPQQIPNLLESFQWDALADYRAD